MLVVFGMFVGVFVFIIEFVGDYYVCVKFVGVFFFLVYVINRGLFFKLEDNNLMNLVWLFILVWIILVYVWMKWIL